jgi:16S rRNA (uracil1498-N3)-methyltransferase
VASNDGKRNVRRAYLKQTLWNDCQAGGQLSLPDELAHYFTRVLRLQAGAPIELFDGEGGGLRGTLVTGPSTTLLVEERLSIENPLPPLWVAQASAPAAKLEQVVRQCTELGASGILIFVAARCKSESKKKQSRRLERLSRIAEDAARQSGRYALPKITEAPSFSEIVSICEEFEGLSVFGAPDGDTTLSTLLVSRAQDLERGYLFVNGPEGGLTQEEKKALQEVGTHPIRLGPYVMRTETAPAVGLAVAQGALGQM